MVSWSSAVVCSDCAWRSLRTCASATRRSSAYTNGTTLIGLDGPGNYGGRLTRLKDAASEHAGLRGD